MSEDLARMKDVASLARKLEAANDEAARLQLVVDAAVELVDRCKYAGITLNRDGSCHTLAASDDTVRACNELQNQSGEGPCHDPHREEEVIVSADLAADARWPRWGARVGTELGARSALSVMIFSGSRSYGTLSLYAGEPSAFGPDDLALVQVLAAHLAVALAASREIDGLGVALHSRTIIGQAEGLLMERLGVDAEQALAYLKRVSSHQNKKLVQVALDLVETRELPTTEE